MMSLLEPNWSQLKPSLQDTQRMCAYIGLEPIPQTDERINQVLERLRLTHSNGGAFLAVVRVEADNTFDWFASRNRLLENEILPLLLHRSEIRGLLPEVKIAENTENLQIAETQNACSITASNGFSFDNPFLLDGQLAQRLFAGGAYEANLKISGRIAMQLAGKYCEAAFDRRYEDVSLFSSYAAWTPWFAGIAWDWTSVLFDRRERKLWILAVTDED
jgi:hypothetical protein